MTSPNTPTKVRPNKRLSLAREATRVHETRLAPRALRHHRGRAVEPREVRPQGLLSPSEDQLKTPAEVQQQIDDVEKLFVGLERVERHLGGVKGRRLAFPGSLALVLLLAWVLFRDEILGAAPGSARFAWMLFFAASYIVGLVMNEVSARRATPRLQRELDSLQAGLQSLRIPESPTSAA